MRQHIFFKNGVEHLDVDTSWHVLWRIDFLNTCSVQSALSMHLSKSGIHAGGGVWAIPDGLQSPYIGPTAALIERWADLFTSLPTTSSETSIQRLR